MLSKNRMVYGGLLLLSLLIISTALGIGIEALRWVLALAALCLVALTAGILTVPKSYSAAGSVRVKAGVHQVFDALANSTDWRTDIQRIEAVPETDGHKRWREIWAPYRIVDMEQIESETPSRIVVQATGSNESYRGLRTWELAALPEGHTLVNFTDRGEFRDFGDRIYQHVFASPQGNVDRYLAALMDHFAKRSAATSTRES